MIVFNNGFPISWVGSELQSDKSTFDKIKNKNIKCFKKCIFGSLTLSVGDFVLVLNTDSKDLGTIKSCDVAQILVLYEIEDKFSPLISEPFRAVVQWFSWPEAIPEKHYDSDNISIDFGKEVIEEHRPYDNDISIETIQNKCFVIRGKVEDSADDLLNKKKTKLPTFLCRYKFMKYRCFKLFPLDEDPKSAKKTPSIKRQSITKTLQRKERHTGTESSPVCRNLNYVYENKSKTQADVLNYSIVESDEISEKNNLKIKLRISKKVNRCLENQDAVKENLVNYNDFCSQNQNDMEDIDPLISLTPKKKIDQLECTPTAKRMTRRKSILKTPGEMNSASNTPKRSIQLSNIIEERYFEKLADPSTPTSKIKAKSPKNNKNLDEANDSTPSKRMKLIKISSLTPTISNREKTKNHRKSDLQIVRENLHVGAVPDCLPCRETEYENIYNFIEHKISSETGGCMYISGVPGTGKTATVTRVIRSLKLKSEMDEIPSFMFIDINGMRLTEPRQAYVQINKQLTGKSLSWEQSYTLLEKRFTTPAPRRTTTVLLVDELDILCNKRQDVVYNILDWPSKPTAKLIVITIANTMDLPERLLLGKVTSRLGLTRLTFQPYTHKQLQEIVTSRLITSKSFKSDAVQLVARKVAAVSGDARRALDICRRATEIAEELDNSKEAYVNMIHVQKALEEMISSAKVQAIKTCSRQEKIFLQAISAEVARTGLEEVVFNSVYTQIESIVAFMGFKLFSISQAFKVCSRLGSQRLIICEHSKADIYQKIILNVSTDDIHFALQNNF